MVQRLSTQPFGVQAGGGLSRATKAPAVFALPFSFDPTSSTQVLLGTLPPNSRVFDVVGFGGTTGGTNPTVDIGTLADDDGYVNELQGDSVKSAVAAGKTGALLNTLQSAATAVYGKVGASAGTGGTFTGKVLFTLEEA